MQAVFLKLLNMSITAGWIVLAVIILRILLKKAPRWITCILWGLIGIRLVFPFSFESFISLIPSAETVPADIIYADSPEIHTGVELINSSVNPVISEVFPGNSPYSANPVQIVLFICSLVWITGAAVMAVYAAVSFIRLKLRVRESVRLKDNIFICDRVNTPFISGVIKPKIYLPSDINETDTEYVLAHENAHIKRLDHITKPAAFLLLCVYWFNPLLWLGFILFCRDIETACDQKVIKSLGETAKRPYSEALMNCSMPRHPFAVCTPAFGEVAVKNRIRSVLSYKKPALWIIPAAIILTVFLSVCLLTDPVSSSVTPIIEQKGYKAVDIIPRSIDFALPKNKIPSEALSTKGMEFNRDDIVLKSFFDTSHIYIKKVYTEIIDGEDWVTLELDFYYTLKKSGTFTVPYTVTLNDGITTSGYSLTLYMPIETVSDDTEKFPNAAFLRGSGSDEKFYVCIKRDAYENADNVIYFSLSGFSDVHYIKKDISYLLGSAPDAAPPQNIELDPNELVFECGIFSYRQSAEDAPSYRIVNGNELHEIGSDNIARVLGELMPVTLDENTFDSFFKYAVSKDDKLTPKALRKNNFSAWTVKTEDAGVTDMYTVLQQKDGTFYIAVGSAEGALYRWVYKTKTLNCSVKGEKKYIRFEYPDSVDFSIPYLLLCEEDKSFVFCYSSLSSYLPRGSYEFEGKTLTLRTDDGKNQYVFIYNGESYMFEAEFSSEIPSYKYFDTSSEALCPIPDGAIFKNAQTVYW